MPSTTLKKLQVGQEASWGAGAAATAMIMGLTDVTLEIVDEVFQSDEKGTYAPSALVAETYQAAAGFWDQDLSYDDILYALDNAFDEESPTGTDPYTWTYVAPDGTQVAPNFYTFEIGGTSYEYEATGALVESFTITGDRETGIWQGSFNFIAELADAASMASLSRRAVELIRMADTVLAVDAWGGTMGATAVASTLRSFELTVNTGRHLKRFAGDINPLSWGDDKYTGTLNTVLEFNASAKAYVDALLTPALVQRQIEIEATSGADSATIQFCGTLSPGPSMWEDAEGNVTVSLDWVGTDNATFGNWLTFIIVNSIGSLT